MWFSNNEFCSDCFFFILQNAYFSLWKNKLNDQDCVVKSLNKGFIVILWKISKFIHIYKWTFSKSFSFKEFRSFYSLIIKLFFLCFFFYYYYNVILIILQLKYRVFRGFWIFLFIFLYTFQKMSKQIFINASLL